MKLIDKLKNMFTEEVEIEDEKPIKKDVIQVEIPAPSRVQRQVQEPIKRDPILEEMKKQEVKRVANEVKEDTLPPKKEEKFVFPVFFDDDDFKNIDDEKARKDKEIVNRENREVKNIYKKDEIRNTKSEVKKFTPTPIISPIYGVLDKNYHKEDITSKNDRVTSKESFDEFSIDSIRKKAYGTLEDDLESNMYAGNSKFLDEKKQVTADMFNEMDDIEKEEYIKHEKIEVVRKVPSRSEKRENKAEIEDNLIAEEMDKNYEMRDNNNDSDLLNLIDSMYDKNGG